MIRETARHALRDDPWSVEKIEQAERVLDRVQCAGKRAGLCNEANREAREAGLARA